ncbi:decapping enzyme complex catalytic subunit DCP1 [Sugiyamaella lignohabitans]|uniref:Decapping enzyme complex catalytic subunit DCP1 n=1 Tax=Sugiyamaella lignohabitans TaxID=796027 RepID=A0A167FPV8_9ASCO|nr:decapping enzyme complex catalytic subunit DCP1 [Sugiyamaella lignohabitans]ANB15549.1 decapping enzyme complex catalytic subunit DCP1 [Sugiyamaella lignohabitans]
MTKALMVKGWRSDSPWGFPKGKINKDEPDELCAIREVYEEIGYDISPFLVSPDYVEVTIQQKSIRLYIVRGIPGNTHFMPRTRKEISVSFHGGRGLPPAAGAPPQTLVVPASQELAQTADGNDSSEARGATGSGAEPQPPEAEGNWVLTRHTEN